MADKPNVTVIFQDAPAKGPTFGAVLLELFVFLLVAGVIALLAGGGCMALWWLR
jgi:hypothetical protein